MRLEPAGQLMNRDLRINPTRSTNLLEQLHPGLLALIGQESTNTQPVQRTPPMSSPTGTRHAKTITSGANSECHSQPPKVSACTTNLVKAERTPTVRSALTKRVCGRTSDMERKALCWLSRKTRNPNPDEDSDCP